MNATLPTMITSLSVGAPAAELLTAQYLGSPQRVNLDDAREPISRLLDDDFSLQFVHDISPHLPLRYEPFSPGKIGLRPLVANPITAVAGWFESLHRDATASVTIAKVFRQLPAGQKGIIFVELMSRLDHQIQENKVRDFSLLLTLFATLYLFLNLSDRNCLIERAKSLLVNGNPEIKYVGLRLLRLAEKHPVGWDIRWDIKQEALQRVLPPMPSEEKDVERMLKYVDALKSAATFEVHDLEYVRWFVSQYTELRKYFGDNTEMIIQRAVLAAISREPVASFSDLTLLVYVIFQQVIQRLESK